MAGLRQFGYKKEVGSILLGQFLSLLITSTGFTSSELARRGINAPTSQSFLNYVLLGLVYGIVVLYRRNALKAKWYYYLILGLVDVEANYLVVKAYQYTSLTSVMLLDCWSIPCVILLTRVFLKTKYRFKKIAGVVICIAGLVMVVFSDVHANDHAGSNFYGILFWHSFHSSALHLFVYSCLLNYGANYLEERFISFGCPYLKQDLEDHNQNLLECLTAFWCCL